jgi:hypothetical protein
MTTRADKDAQAAWKRKLDRLTAAHERARAALNEGIADARAAKVPLTTIADHTPYSREWVRKIADGIDSERTGSDSDGPS